jgi:hypothetical protein
MPMQRSFNAHLRHGKKIFNPPNFIKHLIKVKFKLLKGQKVKIKLFSGVAEPGAELELHHFVRAGAVLICGSSSGGSCLEINFQRKKCSKMAITFFSIFNFLNRTESEEIYLHQ